jgi:hypothetical protein
MLSFVWMLMFQLLCTFFFFVCSIWTVVCAEVYFMIKLRAKSQI